MYELWLERKKLHTGTVRFNVPVDTL